MKICEKGGALLEMAVIAPALLFLALNIYDVTRAVLTLMIMTQIVREGVRYGSGVPFLEAGFFQWKSGTGKYWCGGTPPDLEAGGGVDCTSSILSERLVAENLVRVISFHAREIAIDPNSVTILQELDIVSKPDRYKITLEANFQGVFRLMDGLRLRVKSGGPYVT